MIWNAISDGLPEVKQVVLLHWPVPDMPPIYRLGCLLWEPWDDRAPIWKFELDCGDASATIFSKNDDERPTYWAEVTAPKIDAIEGLIAKGYAVRLPDGGWTLTELGRDAADDAKALAREQGK